MLPALPPVLCFPTRTPALRSEIPDVLGQALTNAWLQPPPERGPGAVHQWEIPGPLTCSTLPNLENFWPFPPSFPGLLCSWHSTQPHSLLFPNEWCQWGQVSKTLPANQSHHLLAGVCSLIISKDKFASGKFVSSAKSALHFSPPPAPLHTSQVSGALIPFLPRLVLLPLLFHVLWSWSSSYCGSFSSALWAYVSKLTCLGFGCFRTCSFCRCQVVQITWRFSNVLGS